MPTLQGLKRVGDIRMSTNKGVVRVEETYHYLVTADYKGQPYIQVANAPGMPQVGLSVATGGLTICKTLSGSPREANPTLWDFTANFSSEVEQNTESPESDPATWVPVYETKFERLEENVTKDLADAAIANSAGQPFEVGLTIGRFIPVWTFTQFEPASVSDETIIGRNENINSGTFKGRAAETLLLTVQSSILGYYYGQPRRLTTYELRYNAKKWTHKRLDVGTVYKSGTDLLAYTDESGNVILGGLNGSGAKVTGGDPPAILEFDIYTQSNFSFLRV